LVVAWAFAAAVFKIILQNNRFFVWSKTFPGAVFRPQFVGRRKGVERQRGFLLGLAPVRSWKIKPSPFEENTNGMLSVTA
jgi:hypothetical protein